MYPVQWLLCARQIDEGIVSVQVLVNLSRPECARIGASAR